uniref:Uncharacterized protein n=1 Tax=Panagrolaimus sp. PS1159 TaxID=55785 RepID=A0AC35FKJ4_9BILA
MVAKYVGAYGFNDENVTLRNDKIEIYNDKYENLPKPLWITTLFFAQAVADSKLASKLLSKVVYCKVRSLSLGYQILNLNEFEMFVGSTDFIFEFCNSIVKSEDGTILSTEEILKLLPKLKYFNWHVGDKMASTFTPETTKAIIDTFDSSILERVYLSDLPQSFDFKLFAKFMDENPEIDFDLHFDRPLSAEYTKILQEYVDDLIDAGLYEDRHIYITFEGQSEESRDILFDYYYGGESPQASSVDGYDSDESAEASSSEYDTVEYDTEDSTQASVADSPKIELEDDKSRYSDTSVTPRSESLRTARSLYDVNSSSDSMGSSSAI